MALGTQERNGRVKERGRVETRRVVGLRTWGVKGTWGTYDGDLRGYGGHGGTHFRNMGG